MGASLADTVDQPADAQSISIVRDEFLTRPLWGVADSGPWLHDGRATTLREAILLHEGEGSEANDSIQKYRQLSPEDQAAVVEFLRSLRVVVKGHEIDPTAKRQVGLMLW
jgi:CxxC motif-containing protein (DUF1111 family)